MQTRPIPADTEIKLTMSAQDINILVAGLNELKMGIAQPTAERLISQVRAQVEEPQEDVSENLRASSGGVEKRD
jgi:hypothetical protein